MRYRTTDERSNAKVLLRNGQVTARVVHPAIDFRTGSRYHRIWHGRWIPVRPLEEPKPHGRTSWLITYQEYKP